MGDSGGSPAVGESGETIRFLGVAADPRLLEDDLDGIPDVAPRPSRAIATTEHDRLVSAGSLMTGATLIVGAVMLIYGVARLVFGNGGLSAVLLAAIGAVLVATHWGWVHVAEYAGLTIDERRTHVSDARGRGWLAELAPYPRFAVYTRVLDDASTVVERVLYQPVLTEAHTFTFVRRADAQVSYPADTPAHVIADEVETQRRSAARETSRQRELWEAADTAYVAALAGAEGDRQELAARRAAATALSEHLNASLRNPPLID